MTAAATSAHHDLADLGRGLLDRLASRRSLAAGASETVATNLAFGMPGCAYAVWRTEQAHRAERLEDVHDILRGLPFEGPSAATSKFGPSRDCSSSLAYGPTGLHFVATLVAHARGDTVEYERRLAAFLSGCRALRPRPHEVIFGRAGLLNGARILHAHTRDERFSRAADALAAALVARCASWPDGWLSHEEWGFAHGAMGILHALLAWSDREPSPELVSGLDAFADMVTEGRLALRPDFHEPLRDSWCNGSSGAVLLWVKAYECLGVERYRRLAIDAARPLSSRRGGPIGDACCGSIGRAYAMLAMDRLEPGSGWYERARLESVEAARALKAACGPWPRGLYKGYPGLVCLLRDLDCPPSGRAGFPLIEG